MATSKNVPQAGNGLGGIADILQLLGGSKQTTTGTANTAPLEQILARLQSGGQDYSKLLEAVFQQASGQIPKFQAAYGNAVGARSGNNSAVANSLSELLKAATLEGQKQIVQQQQNNDQNQINAASGIANATRGQTIRTPGMGKELLALQLLSKSGGLDKIKKTFSDMFPSGSSNGSVSDAGTNLFASDSADSFSNVGGGALGDFSSIGDISNLASGGFDIADTLSSLSDIGGITNTVSDIGATVGGLSDLAGTGDTLDWVGGLLGFAGGGLVGRDGETDSGEKGEGTANEDASEGEIQEAALRQYLERGIENFNIPGFDLPGFADGGIVSLRAGGSRRGSNPEFTPDSVATSSVYRPKATNSGSSDSVANTLDGAGGAPSIDSSGSFNAGQAARGIGRAFGVMTANPITLVSLLADIIKEAVNRPSLSSPNEGQPEGGIGGMFGGDIGIGNSGLDGSFGGMGIGGTGETGTDNGFGGGETSGADAGSDAGAEGSDAGAGDTGSDGTGGDAEGGTGDGNGGGDAGAGYRKGGEVDGPGTGKSDSILARLSDGEYVVRADVVKKLGVDFFDNLQSLVAKK